MHHVSPCLICDHETLRLQLSSSDGFQTVQARCRNTILTINQINVLERCRREACIMCSCRGGLHSLRVCVFVCVCECNFWCVLLTELAWVCRESMHFQRTEGSTINAIGINEASLKLENGWPAAWEAAVHVSSCRCGPLPASLSVCERMGVHACGSQSGSQSEASMQYIYTFAYLCTT
jgi:hypothetical protein